MMQWISKIVVAAACLFSSGPAHAAATRASLPPAEMERRAVDRLLSTAARIRWTRGGASKFIEKMPKVETHLHLDGALTQKRIAALARSQPGSALSGKSAAEIRAATMVTTPRASLKEVLDAFFSFYPLLMTPEAMEAAARDLMSSARAQNIRYVEVRFAPSLQSSEKHSMEDILQGVLRGLKTGGGTTGVKSGVIVCLFRPLPHAVNETMLELAIKYKGRGVVGIDLAGDEAKNPLSETADLYARAKAAGLHTTVHAGEVPGSRDLELALSLGVNRVSHATLLSEKPELVREIAARRMAVEVNLTSNLRTGAVKDLAEHPSKAWFRAGIPITLSTDDPGVFGNTLSDEYRILHEALGLSMPEIIAADLAGIDALFVPDAEKAALRRRFIAELDDLLRKQPVN